MDGNVGKDLVDLVRGHRTAALGTLLDGGPLVSMILYDASPDLSAFHVHVSRLAQHTTALMQSPFVALMIAEADGPSRNPQTLARLSIRGVSEPLSTADEGYTVARDSYLRKFPKSTMTFGLADFLLVRIVPSTARLVTGFGAIHDLSAEDMVRLALHHAPDTA